MAEGNVANPEDGNAYNYPSLLYNQGTAHTNHLCPSFTIPAEYIVRVGLQLALGSSGARFMVSTNCCETEDGGESGLAQTICCPKLSDLIRSPRTSEVSFERSEEQPPREHRWLVELTAVGARVASP